MEFWWNKKSSLKLSKAFQVCISRKSSPGKGFHEAEPASCSPWQLFPALPACSRLLFLWMLYRRLLRVPLGDNLPCLTHEVYHVFAFGTGRENLTTGLPGEKLFTLLVCLWSGCFHQKMREIKVSCFFPSTMHWSVVIGLLGIPTTAHLHQALAVAQAAAYTDSFLVSPALPQEFYFMKLCKHIKSAWGNRNLIFQLWDK